MHLVLGESRLQGAHERRAGKELIEGPRGTGVQTLKTARADDAVRVIVDGLELESAALVSKHAQIVQFGVLGLELLVEDDFAAVLFAFDGQKFADALAVALAAAGALFLRIPMILVPKTPRT